MKTLILLRSNLRSARLNAGLTQQVLAECASLPYKYYQDLEAGRLKGLTLATIERLAAALHAEVWQLFHPAIIPAPTRKRARAPLLPR